MVSAAPAGRQLVFASATVEAQTREVLATMAPGAEMLQAGAAAVNENIQHLYVICEERDKPDVLRKLLHAFELPRSIVFVHRNEVAERVAAKLAHHKLEVADLERGARQARPQAGDGRHSQRRRSAS